MLHQDIECTRTSIVPTPTVLVVQTPSWVCQCRWCHVNNGTFSQTCPEFWAWLRRKLSTKYPRCLEPGCCNLVELLALVQCRSAARWILSLKSGYWSKGDSRDASPDHGHRCLAQGRFDRHKIWQVTRRVWFIVKILTYSLYYFSIHCIKLVFEFKFDLHNP